MKFENIPTASPELIERFKRDGEKVVYTDENGTCEGYRLGDETLITKLVPIPEN